MMLSESRRQSKPRSENDKDAIGPELRTLLDMPRTNQGDLALASLESLLKSWKQKDEALSSLETAKDALMDAVLRGCEASRKKANCADPFNSRHAATVQKWTQIFRKRSSDVDHFYKQFCSIDETVMSAQKQLHTAYDSYHTILLQIEANNEVVRLREEQLQREIDEKLAAERKPLDDFSRTSLADFFHKAMKNGSSAQDIIASNQRAVKILSVIVKFQARYRGYRRRRQTAMLWRCRCTCDRICVHYQFYMWRAHVRGELFRRRRLCRLVFVGLQANANTSCHRRSGFALHFARAREIATLFRTCVMWHRYTQWLKAPVDPETHEREISFEFSFEAWNEFLVERHSLAVTRSAAMRFGEHANVKHPLLVLGHFIDKWRRFVTHRRRKRQRILDAVRYRERVVVRNHFCAWSTFVGFSAQKDAWACATQLFYFMVWKRVLFRRRREAQYVSLFPALKKYHCLTKWRRRTVGLRQTQTSSSTVMQVFRCNALMTLYCITGEPRFFFIRAWKRWRQYVNGRQLWRAWVAQRWAKRTVTLKRICFSYWRSYVDRSRKRSSYKLDRQALASRDSGKELLAEHASLITKQEIIRTQKIISKLTSDIVALDTETSSPDTLDTSLMRDIPLFANTTQEEAMVQKRFVEWRKNTIVRDIPLLTAAVSLLLFTLRTSGRRPTLLPSKSCRSMDTMNSLRSDSPTESCTSPKSTKSIRSSRMQKRPQNERILWNRFALMLVGDPFYNAKKGELCIAQVEKHVREESMRGTVVRIKSDRRDHRILSKIEARLAAFRFYNVCPFFTMEDPSNMHPGHSPFEFMMEAYNNIMSERKNSSRSAYGKTKYTIPLPPVLPSRRLPFLLRLHFDDFISERMHQIRSRAVFRARVSRAVLLAKYVRLNSMLPSGENADKKTQAAARLATDESRSLKCRRTLMSIHKALSSRFCVDFATIFREHSPNVLDLLGFNPQYIRSSGSSRSDLRRNKRLRRYMAAQAKALAEVGLSQKRRRYSFIHLQQLVTLQDKAAILGTKRRNSITVSTRHQTLLQEIEEMEHRERQRRVREAAEVREADLEDVPDTDTESAHTSMDESSTSSKASVEEAEGEESLEEEPRIDEPPQEQPVEEKPPEDVSQPQQQGEEEPKSPSELSPKTENGAQPPADEPEVEETDVKKLDVSMKAPSNFAQQQPVELPTITTDDAEDQPMGPFTEANVKGTLGLELGALPRPTTPCVVDSEDEDEEGAEYLARVGDNKGKRPKRKSNAAGGECVEEDARKRKIRKLSKGVHKIPDVAAQSTLHKRGAREAGAGADKNAFQFTVIDIRVPQMDNVPHIWESDDSRKTVRSSERLLELSARYGAVLQHTSAAHLEGLKDNIFALASGDTSSVQKPKEEQSNKNSERKPSPLHVQRTVVPRRALSSPSFSPTRMGYESPVGRQAQHHLPSRHDHHAVYDIAQQMSPKPTLYDVAQQRPNEARYIPRPVAVQPQYLMVPYNFKGKEVARTFLAMESTAALFNTGPTNSQTPLNDPSHDVGEEGRRLLRRRHVDRVPPGSWARPWQTERIQSVRILERPSGSVERPYSVQSLSTSGVVGDDFVKHHLKSNRSSFEQFYLWLDNVSAMSKSPQGCSEAFDLLHAERALLARQQNSYDERLNALPANSEIRPSLHCLQENVAAQIACVDGAIRRIKGSDDGSVLQGHSVVPTHRPTSRQAPLPVRVRTQVSEARPFGESPLDDVTTSRLIEFLTNAA